MGINEDTFLRLILIHRGMLLGYIRSIVRDHHLAEDILQDVSIIALNKRAHFTEDSFPGWIRKAARFEAMNALRKQKRIPQVLDDSILELIEDQWEKADSPAPSRTVEVLRTCLEKLTQNSRHLVNLRYEQNLSGQELAQKLKKQLNTVYVALSRIHRTVGNCVKMGMSKQGVTYD